MFDFFKAKYVTLHTISYIYVNTMVVIVGRPWLRYKDKLKRNVCWVNIPFKNFEDVAMKRSEYMILAVIQA